jgi:hypothetical protein
MDMMAFLNLPKERQDVTRSDFIRWAETYLVPALSQKISGKDLYGARCGVLRGTDSRLTREGQSRMIRYRDSQEPATVLPVETLAFAFFTAVDAFVADALGSDSRAALLIQRLEQMLKILPF